MSNFQELEVKVLNINSTEIKRKLDEIKAEFKGEVLQKIYTYDCYTPIHMYELALSDYEYTKTKNSLMKIGNVFSYIEPILTKEDKETIKSVCQYESISEYINNCDKIEINILKNEKIRKIIKESEKKFFKWIRLRQNGDKVELTIKYIYSAQSEYKIDKVKEYEMIVDNFEIANIIIEQMGYYRKRLAEKRRTSYQLEGVKIEIDEWPLIKPYIEIEGETTEKIYDVLNKLGFRDSDAVVMNTEDVYLREGYDLSTFEILTFDKQKLI